MIIIPNKKYIERDSPSDIIKHGYKLLQDVLTIEDIRFVQELWNKKDFIGIKSFCHTNKKLLTSIQKILGEDYMLMDYIWYIENSVVHTCHRDNNSHLFKFNGNPRRSYTMILYVDDMEKCLDVIPKSNNIGYGYTGMNIYDATNTILCKPGDLLIFDANLIHAGSLESNDKNRRIQLKVTHKYDIEKIGYYTNVERILDKHNTNSEFSKIIQKNLSCQFPIISDLTQDANKESVNIEKEPSFLQKAYSYIFYSDTDFYKLKKVEN